MLVGERLVAGVPDLLGGGLGRADVVLAVHQDLRLHDRDEAILLAGGGVAGEAVGILADGLLGRGGLAVRDLEHRAPLSEASAELVVLGAARAEAVEAGAVGLAVGTGERLDALVDLDADDDVLVGQELGERDLLLGGLADGLIEDDAAGDVVAQVLGGEEQLAVSATVLLGVLDADRGEALADGAVGLVRGEDALAAARDGLGRGRELVAVLRTRSSRDLGAGLVGEAEGARGGGLGRLGTGFCFLGGRGLLGGGSALGGHRG